MSHTIRWYQIPQKINRILKRPWININESYNPFYYKHENKYIRIEEHRKYRHRNRIRIRKGMDILYEPKTCGWNSH